MVDNEINLADQSFTINYLACHDIGKEIDRCALIETRPNGRILGVAGPNTPDLPGGSIHPAGKNIAVSVDIKRPPNRSLRNGHRIFPGGATVSRSTKLPSVEIVTSRTPTL